MADPCPRCDHPLSLDNTFCKGCGYELELAVADYEGEGADLGGGFDYDRSLQNLGLADPEDQPAPWAALAWIALVVTLVLILSVWRLL